MILQFIDIESCFKLTYFECSIFLTCSGNIINSKMDQLKDPNNSRIVKTLPLPPARPLTTEQIFKDGHIDWRLLRSFLKK